MLIKQQMFITMTVDYVPGADKFAAFAKLFNSTNAAISLVNITEAIYQETLTDIVNQIPKEVLIYFFMSILVISWICILLTCQQRNSYEIVGYNFAQISENIARELDRFITTLSPEELQLLSEWNPNISEISASARSRQNDDNQ
jgi:hypothetical protein